MCDTYISAYAIACLESVVIKFNLNRDYDLKIPSGPPVTHSRFAVWSGSVLSDLADVFLMNHLKGIN